MNELTEVSGLENTNDIKTSEKLLSIIFALCIGIVFDKFIKEKALGVSYYIFIFLSVSFFLWSLRKTIKPEVNFGWLLLIPINLLAFNFAFYTNSIFQVLNFLLIPLLMVTSSILISNRTIVWDKITFIQELVIKALIDPLKNIGSPFKILIEASVKKNKKGMSPIQKQILLGLLISLPLLFIIMLLLISADMVFSYYVGNISKIFDSPNLDQIISDTLVIATIAIYLFCYVWAFRKSEKKEQRQVVESGSWQSVTIITILTMLNILYTLFTIIQFSYLYNGVDGGLPAGFTFAEYARRGFFELVAVTFVNFMILVGCFTFMKKENRKLGAIANVMLTLLILFTINMLWSAHSRLSLYELTYGLTYLRVFVHIFMALLSVLCLIALVNIWYRRIPFIKVVIAVSIICYTLVNYINIDRFIIKENIANKKLDISYLIRLSDEVVPYLIDLQKNTEISDTDKILIKENLLQRKTKINRQDKWYEFNFSRNNARKLLKGVQ
ncbi:MAG: DUF4173 domain-containing protein [Clostridiaceae bacterium]|nr:DUF4173 domain-containing protein [Clostridiaceae bacterium]